MSLRAALEAFDAATRSRPDSIVESSYLLAGLPVSLRVVGRELAGQMSRAIRHLRCTQAEPGPPALRIELWDREATGIDWPSGTCLNHGPNRWETGRGQVMTSRDRRFVRCVDGQSAVGLDRVQDRLIGCWRSGRRLSLLERGKPLCFLLTLWQRRHGIQVVHAGLVSRGGRGVLLPGLSGAGKTTATMACMLSGFQFLGDDHVAVGQVNCQWVGYSMYASAWLTPQHLDRFPDLQDCVVAGAPPPADKRLVILDGERSGLAKSADIGVLAIPRVSEAQGSRHRPASKAEALRALCLGTLTGVAPRPGVRDLEFLAELVDRVPSVWIDVGRRIADIPRCMDLLLEEVAG